MFIKVGMELNVKTIKFCINSFSSFAKGGEKKIASLVDKYGSKTIFSRKSAIYSLEHDVVKLNEKTFTPLEKSLMDSVRPLKAEQCYIIDKDNNLDTKIKFIRSKNGCDISFNECSMDLINRVMKDATVVHNHPSKLLLSPDDLYTMANKRIKKMIATTPDGGYSVLERKVSWTEEQYNNFIRACVPFHNEEYYEIKRFASIRGIRNAERTNMLNDWRCKKIDKLADDFGLEFYKKINKTTSLDQTLNETFKINFIQNFTDNLIFYTKNK